MSAPTPIRRRPWLLRALGSNPLVRSQDRTESTIAALLVVVLALMIPVAMFVGGVVDNDARERNAQYLQSLTPVEATVTSVRSNAPSRMPQLLQVATVEWTWAFEQRTTSVTRKEPTKVGDHLTVWVDANGQVAEPPKTEDELRGPGLGAGLATWITAAVACLGIWYALRLRLDRRRYADWDEQWLLFSTGGNRANRDR